jgi:hypothetical protein
MLSSDYTVNAANVSCKINRQDKKNTKTLEMVGLPNQSTEP